MFPDPFVICPWAGAGSTCVIFSKYVSGIWNTDALNAILEASRVVAIENFRGNGNKLIGKDLKYAFGSVTLTFTPGPSLKWSTWGLVLAAFPELFKQYEYTGFSFTVNDAYRPAGTGILGRSAIANPAETS